MIKHDDGTKDNRYTYGLEYCGYSVPMHCVRFCGELIGVARDADKALHIAQTHKQERMVSYV